MMFFLFYAFPSGLNLYYLCFNIMQILQQKIINNETSNNSSIGS
jgi:YidC/Oxa1 family membrane protein insertase